MIAARRFGTAFGTIFRVRVSSSSLDIRRLKMGLPRYPETSGAIHPVMLHTLSEYQGLHDLIFLSK